MYNSKTNSLKHFGTLGQKWGIRKYQNEDGTLTEEGKIRYYGSDKIGKTQKQIMRTYYDDIKKMSPAQASRKVRQSYRKTSYAKAMDLGKNATNTLIGTGIMYCAYKDAEKYVKAGQRIPSHDILALYAGAIKGGYGLGSMAGGALAKNISKIYK